jgi:hypothetical protein
VSGFGNAAVAIDLFNGLGDDFLRYTEDPIWLDVDAVAFSHPQRYSYPWEDTILREVVRYTQPSRMARVASNVLGQWNGRVVAGIDRADGMGISRYRLNQYSRFLVDVERAIDKWSFQDHYFELARAGDLRDSRMLASVVHDVFEWSAKNSRSRDDYANLLSNLLVLCLEQAWHARARDMLFNEELRREEQASSANHKHDWPGWP